jgi:hypothetical protein
MKVSPAMPPAPPGKNALMRSFSKKLPGIMCPIQNPGKFKIGMLTDLVAKRIVTGMQYRTAPAISHNQNRLLLNVAIVALRKLMIPQKTFGR